MGASENAVTAALNRFGRELTVWRAMKFFLGACSIALALAWSKYIGVGYVYLPGFPDYLDATLGIIIGVFLLSDYFKR